MEKTIKLLLIEDNPLDAKLFQRLLDRSSRTSYKLEFAGTLSDAFEFLESNGDIDAIVIDLNLPDSQGLDTFRAVRLKHPNLPLIVLTADDDDRLALKAVQAGAQDYIVKGDLSPMFLGRAIRYAIERQSSESRIHQLNHDLEKRVLDLAAANKNLDRLSHGLSLARDEAVQAAAYKSEFVAKMSHEIRTPIAAVLGTIDLLKTTELNDEQKDLVEIIHASAESLLNSVSDVLDYSKLESGQVELEVKDFSPVRLLEGTADLVAQSTSKKGLSIMSFVDPYIPEMLQGDPVRIRQILLNLLGNAIKYTKRGEVCVQATKESYDDLSMLVRFSVIDTGPGLSENDIANLFQPFSEANAQTNESGDGAGLGLTISKRLVELMGGQMGVESDEGRGSTFWFSIRLRRSTNKKFLEALPLPSMASELIGLRVLVADDTKSTRQIIQSYLKAARFHTSAAANSEEALEMLRHARQKDTPYDVAIIGLAKKDGSVKLAKEIQDDPTISRTRLVYLTQQNQNVEQDDLWKTGFSSCLTKPVRQAALIASIFDVMYGMLDIEIDTREDEEEATETKEVEAPDVPAKVRRDQAKKMKVLVAEDNKFLLQVMKRTLKHLGYAVDLAANGSEAVKKHASGEYGLILMDCQMPIMNGYEATSAIRKAEDGKSRTPIVAMTASIQKSVREKCFECGMDDFLSKPVTIEQLQKVLSVLSHDSNNTEVIATDETQPGETKS
jgi:two-component system, sensor histidine kinase and response regulator